ncbi:hypothetical protein [Clostridium sp. DJ247]|nr:hypothetical protein [Clostridium sp. DJ247]MBC2579743.1 hypothetical protein [Clostridium sp. DJ247]
MAPDKSCNMDVPWMLTITEYTALNAYIVIGIIPSLFSLYRIYKNRE